MDSEVKILKKKKLKAEDLDSLRQEVASFSSSLGLATENAVVSSTGFDDRDFRKKGPIDRSKPVKEKPSDDAKAENRDSIEQSHKRQRQPQQEEQSDKAKRAKPSKIQTLFKKAGNDEVKKRDLGPQLPLMKPNTLSNPWYLDAQDLESKFVKGVTAMPGVSSKLEWSSVVENKRKLAEKLMQQYVSHYNNLKRKNADLRMVAAAEKSGTTADKVAATIVLLQDNPIANLKTLDTTLGMITSKVGKRHAVNGIDPLKELFVFNLLPDRKLKYLFQQPLNVLTDTKDGHSLLLFWYWEDCLKHRYERFVIALEEASKDDLPFLKNKALKAIFELLKDKPEQERRLLSSLVNKLGDPERKIASNAGYHLSRLLTAHPNMKAVVIEEVDNFIFRANIGLRARYNAVLFLSQIFLSKKGDGPMIAKRLVDIYFALFKVLTCKDAEVKEDTRNLKDHKRRSNTKFKKKKQHALHDKAPVEIDSRLLSALLTGVNRAFPFVATDEADVVIENETPVLFQLVHSSNFNIVVQALMLLYQLLTKNQTVSDRFYRALYSALLAPALMNSSKIEMFLGLLFKVLKADLNVRRVPAFVKRLLQVALQQSPNFACACLLLVSELLKARPTLWNAVLEPEDDDKDVEHFVDIAEGDEHPEYKSDKNHNENLGKASRDIFAKDSDESGSSEATMNEDHSETSGDDWDDSAEDFFKNKFDDSKRINTSKEKSANTRDVLHSENDSQKSRRSIWPKPDYYDPEKREPAFCNADSACWWELTTLAAHVHPSVAVMAKTLLTGSNIIYKGDPLTDLALGAFMDKFIEKKPKPSKKLTGEWHGGSDIAPARKVDIAPSVVGRDLLKLAEEEVAPEDVVFHKFYVAKANSSKKPKKKKKQKDTDEALEDDLLGEGNSDIEDDFEGDDESDNDEIDKLIDETAEGDNHSDEEYGYKKLGDGIDAVDDNNEEYDYEKLGDAIDFEDEDLLVDGGEDETQILEDISEHDVSDTDEKLHSQSNSSDIIGNKKSKRGKSKEKIKKSPFASFDDYSHLMDDEETAERPKPKHKSVKKKNVKSMKLS
eukprot:TRINITY_DN4287_c0_g1_i1.p1 TRINITY_DN4287_c0_g1~~TRINITY_DN4287_c0_g1_i1.p1  ORF type:complete len:1060 (-),score=290.87 TRINITY_DN4287_c0_g1_i1:464-3643(-)